MVSTNKSLHLDKLPIQTKKVLDILSQQAWLKESDWYLAGGTALYLQAGHRTSFDLDFFTLSKEINNVDLLLNLMTMKDWKTDINKRNTIYGTLFDAKVSFISYPFLTPKHEFLTYGTVKILDARDIALVSN